MLRYLAKSEIGGIEIRLIESQFAFVVIYGMEKTTFKKTDGQKARDCFNAAIQHAQECTGE